jgi:hypothetical protein
MHLPDLQGTFDQQDFFIYAACDRQYFAEFGPSFIGSIRANTNFDIHLHLFNPAPEQIEFCQQHGVGVTWEYAHLPLFVSASQQWSSLPTQEPKKTQYDRTLNAMQKGNDAGVLERMQKTYYACARFVRLAEIYQDQTVLAIDIDAVICRDVPLLQSGPDFYIHHISGRRARYLAGGLWLTGTERARKFLQQYSNQLKTYIEQDYLYWGLDQDLLDPIVPKFNHSQLPAAYIDWNMQPDSYIWTAKGTRKNLDIFVSEQKKYNV